jgi:hypothetical protein
MRFSTSARAAAWPRLGLKCLKQLEPRSAAIIGSQIVRVNNLIGLFASRESVYARRAKEKASALPLMNADVLIALTRLRVVREKKSPLPAKLSEAGMV